MEQTTVSSRKVKFSTQLSQDVLVTLKEMGTREGRQLQAILDEALREYIENRQNDKPKKYVLSALQSSIAEHDALYKALSK